MQLTVKNWDNFDHARWRVEFLRSLVQMHQTSPKRGSESWTQEEVEFTQRLEAAEKELARFPKEWQTLPKSKIPRR
ncbi:MAG TPA: hypothetical protein VLE43_11045 [Candidatus Saccharimonadia bacterium]|nr:hypothetical protein [Candidatus Saccharimonadia bacterium]